MNRARSAFVVSLDFELHWGLHDKLSVAAYRDNLLGVRESVPALLRLFEEFRIHATWATVGFLFCRDKRELLAARPARRPVYAEPRLSAYDILDGVGADEREDPFHYAPSLIDRIDATAGQEIATHTFSHYYCLEPGQSPDDFRADLDAAVAIGRRRLGREPRSIVFARNQVSAPHLAVCRDFGIRAYRGNQDHWCYRERAGGDERLLRRGCRLLDAYLPVTGRQGSVLRPDPTPDLPKRAGSLVDIRASRYLRPFAPALRRLDPLRLRRIAGELRAAAHRGATYHLWWHPHDFGVNLAANLAFLRSILVAFDTLRERHGMESLTMEEAAARAVLAVTRPVRRSGTSARR